MDSELISKGRCQVGETLGEASFSRQVRTIVLQDVVVTGFGAVSSLGGAQGAAAIPNFPDMPQALIEGKEGVGETTRFPHAKIPHKLAAEVPGLSDLRVRGLSKDVGLSQKMAMVAGEAALADANLKESSPYDEKRSGVFVGGDFEAINLDKWRQLFRHMVSFVGNFDPERFYEAITKEWPANWITSWCMTNAPLTQLSKRFGLRGRGFTNSQACAASTVAIGEAFEKIKFGACDMVLAGGTSAKVIPFFVAGFERLGVMSKSDSARPYDQDRDGFIIGEGSAFFVLERADKARQRGAGIYARIAGYASFNDGRSLTDPDRSGIAMTIREALTEAGIEPGDIGYINTHGSATLKGDEVEAFALKEVFGDRLSQIPLSSSKGAIGHEIDNSGAGELAAVLCCLAKDGSLPPTVGLKTLDDNFKFLNPVMNGDHVKLKKKHILKLSLGFGGTNSAMVLEVFC